QSPSKQPQLPVRNKTRRGSNVSLVLDMSALGSVEPLNVSVVTPRETAAREYLLSAGRPLTRQQLRDVISNTHKLHVEFAVSPPNRSADLL
uniref:protein-tyrosine-phosphatase n=1 Tax=Xiphophorus couchianus TaxID=32473 RepID=A0A3B5M7H3_9TELE